MTFDKALKSAHNKNKVALSYWKEGKYIHLLHNVMANSDGSNYRPTVTEMNSDMWVVL